MKTPLTFLLSLTFLFLFSCSDQKSKNKVKQIENPKIKESLKTYIIGENSLRNYLTPKIKSLDIGKLKALGYIPAYSENSEENEYLNPNEFTLNIFGQSIPKEFYKEMGFMRGHVRLLGANNQFGKLVFKSLNMDFVKFNKNESWKLITYAVMQKMLQKI